MKSNFQFLTLLTLISSCSLIGFNPSKKTPARAGKYPQFTVRDSLLGGLNPKRSSFDVHYYDINLNFDLTQKFITGYVDIYFSAVTNLDTIQLDLAHNMQLNSVELDGVKLQTVRLYDAVFIAMNRKVAKGEKLKLRVYYEGKPLAAKNPPWAGGFVWKKDKLKNPWVGVACEKLGANIWWPLKDHLSDEPDSALINITIPKGLFCVSNGKLVSRRLNDSATAEQFSWKVSYPINTYNITFYIGNFEHFTLPYDSVHQLDFYVLKQNKEVAMEHFKQASSVVKVFEDLYGEYPFWRDGYKLVESPYEGMEHQSAIAYGHGYKNSSDGFDYIILHETAHEWWGNAVSVKDYADIWIHEGMATYSEALYVEKTKGYEAYLRYLDFYSWMVINKKPVVGPKDVNYWNYNDSDPYMKGALMMHSLRFVIDKDSLFFDVLKTFYNRFKYKTVTTADFISLVNEKTGTDYNWFFSQYLYSRKSPKFVFRLDKATYRVYYKWEDTNADFKMPVKIRNGVNESLLMPTNVEKSFLLDAYENLYIEDQKSYFRIKRKR